MKRHSHSLVSFLCVLLGGVLSVGISAQVATPAVAQSSMSDAWWTGPMLANSAETLPPGHFLLEPYVYDVSAAHSDSFGSRSYLLYGLADNFSIGMIPVLGYNRVSSEPNSAGIGLGDLTLQAQYRLSEFQPGSWMPTTAIQLQETLPTGRYDRLGNRPSDGLGNGVYTTTLGLNSQTYFWLPNGRILRMRFNLSEAISNTAHVQGVSVYGTGNGFRGSAKPGDSFFADAAWEYSMTQRWVLALDLLYSHAQGTRVSGVDTADSLAPTAPSMLRMNSGTSHAFGFAPALEYNWTPNLGVLLGTRVILAGHGTTGTVTPAVALNYVH